MAYNTTENDTKSIIDKLTPDQQEEVNKAIKKLQEGSFPAAEQENNKDLLNKTEEKQNNR